MVGEDGLAVTEYAVMLSLIVIMALGAITALGGKMVTVFTFDYEALNRFFCVPKARFLGVTPQDVVDYDLPTHELKEQDIKRAQDAMKNDPFVHHYKAWQKALEQMLKMRKRVEQQAFAKYGLDFVVKDYLPKKLKDPSNFLP